MAARQRLIIQMLEEGYFFEIPRSQKWHQSNMVGDYATKINSASIQLMQQSFDLLVQPKLEHFNDSLDMGDIEEPMITTQTDSLYKLDKEDFQLPKPINQPAMRQKTKLRKNIVKRVSLDDSFTQFLKEDSKNTDINMLEPDQRIKLENSLKNLVGQDQNQV